MCHCGGPACETKVWQGQVEGQALPHPTDSRRGRCPGSCASVSVHTGPPLLLRAPVRDQRHPHDLVEADPSCKEDKAKQGQTRPRSQVLDARSASFLLGRTVQATVRVTCISDKLLFSFLSFKQQHIKRGGKGTPQRGGSRSECTGRTGDRRRGGLRHPWHRGNRESSVTSTAAVGEPPVGGSALPQAGPSGPPPSPPSPCPRRPGRPVKHPRPRLVKLQPVTHAPSPHPQSSLVCVIAVEAGPLAATSLFACQVLRDLVRVCPRVSRCRAALQSRRCGRLTCPGNRSQRQAEARDRRARLFPPALGCLCDVLVLRR